MKKFRLTTAVLAALTLASVACSKYDDSALLNEIKNLKDRITNLENQEPVDNSLKIVMNDNPICFAAVDSLAYTGQLSIPFTIVGEGAETAVVSVDVSNPTEPDAYLYTSYEMTDATHGVANVSRYLDTECDGGEIYSSATGYELRVSASNKNGQSAFRIVKVLPQYYDFAYDECDIMYDNVNKRAYIEASNKAGLYRLDMLFDVYCTPEEVEAVSNSPQVLFLRPSVFAENEIKGMTVTEFVQHGNTVVSDATYFSLGTGFKYVRRSYSADISWPANTTGKDRKGLVYIYQKLGPDSASSSITTLWIYQSK